MDGEWSKGPGRNARGNLAARGRPARTFSGLLGFTAVLFLGCGGYLIAEPMIHPMAVHDAGVIVGAFTLALAVTLLFYLVKPGARQRSVSAAEAAELREERKARPNLAFQPVRMRRTRTRL